MKSSRYVATLMALFLTAGCGSSVSTTPVGSSAASTSNATSTAGTTTALSLAVSSSTVVEGGTVTVTASGGVSPYTYYSEDTNFGTINSSTGVFTASSSETGTATVAVLDSDGNTATASITVSGSTTSTSTTLVITPSATSIAAGGTVTFTISGGTAPYLYLLPVGDGSLSVSGTSTSTTTTYTSSSLDSTNIELEVIDSSSPAQIVYSSVAISGTSSSTGTGTTATGCSTAPVALLSAVYDDTKSIQAYYSPYGGTCVLSASPDKNDTITCTGMTNVPAMSAYYYSCSGSMKMYGIEVNGVDTFGEFAGLPNGECNGGFTSYSAPVSAAITQLQIDARSGEQVIIYGVPSCD